MSLKISELLRKVSNLSFCSKPRKKVRRRSSHEWQSETLEARTLLSATFSEFVDPNPAPGNEFGRHVVPLTTGNVVITSPGDDANGLDTGAAYLFDGQTGALISTLQGSTTGDFQNAFVTALSNGNFVLHTRNWDNGSAVDAGAATFGNGVTGVAGMIGPAVSLVGSSSGDQVGYGIIELSNGNYVVPSAQWDNGLAQDAGAVTFGSGITGVTGVVSPANSLVGDQTGDFVGQITPLPNGNYVVRSQKWHGERGAVTLGNGNTGTVGTVDSNNSLVGTTEFDRIGQVVTVLTNGNYVVSAAGWDHGTMENAGAVTFGDAQLGVTGEVGPGNSLVGSSSLDLAGMVIHPLSNGNYVVQSHNWTSGAQMGAVTWGSGTSGIVGVVSAANSLVSDSGISEVTVLTNGNYVVASQGWGNGRGAVTFGNGNTGISGVISAANSLVGARETEMDGFLRIEGDLTGEVVALTNGNYVVITRNFGYEDQFGVFRAKAGAVTWANGTTGLTGVVSTGNSLVGTSTDDGSLDVTPLANGNYVVSMPRWDDDGVVDVGAVTLGNGATGTSGFVSTANSLTGDSSGDQVGWNVHALPTGNFLVYSPWFRNDAAGHYSAVTFVNGTSGLTGHVSSSNSLVGSTPGDNIGNDFNSGFVPITFSNGDFLLVSPEWDRGSVVDAGAITFGSGTTGVSGVVSASNSLVGSSANEFPNVFNGNNVEELATGNFALEIFFWNNGAVVDAGAVTFVQPETGFRGEISAQNSLVGTSTDDRIGNVLSFANGNYVVWSNSWDTLTQENVGSVTVVNGETGLAAPVNGHNSLIGEVANSGLQVFMNHQRDTAYARFLNDGGGRVIVVDGNIADTSNYSSDLVGQLNGNWWVAKSDGASSFTNELWGGWDANAGWTDVQTADVDGDGDSDIVGRTSSGQWWVARNTGSSFNTEYWGYWSDLGWQDVLVADVDGDGDDDIVGRSSTGQWWVARSNGASGFTNELWGGWVESAGWNHVQIADLNGDGNADIIGQANNGQWWAAQSNGSSFSTEYWGYWVDLGWQDVQVADVDNDGDSDLVGRSSTGQWWVARSNGSNQYVNELWGGWVETAGWMNVLVADLDGDGNQDIIGQANNGQWWAARSDGSSFTTEYWGYWVDLGWQDVQVIDVDQDGNADIVGRANSGSLWVARSNGSNGFTNELWGQFAGTGWQNVMVANTGIGSQSSFVNQLDDDDDRKYFLLGDPTAT